MTYNLKMPTGEGAHKVENIAGQASLDGQGGTEPASVLSVPPLLICNDKLDVSDEKRTA